MATVSVKGRKARTRKRRGNGVERGVDARACEREPREG
jgi:hypothetical protein